MTELRYYLDNYSDIHGYLTQEAIISWDFFLVTQNNMKTRGAFFEIGILEGKSATLGAMYLGVDEDMILVDINPCETALQRLRGIRPDGVIFLQGTSFAAGLSDQVNMRAGRYRFIHIDGDHSGYNVTGDLQLAARILKEDGVICMDDFFNPIYPQVTASVYRFLMDNAMTFRMVLCGGNKCFLVRASSYRFYEEMIRKYFMDHAAAYGARFSLHKTSFIHDFGCFSIWTENDRRAFGIEFKPEDKRTFGIDSDQNDIVF
jgi:ubiquinone/menaquinone biosynthesis C-methylase UbiE